MNSLTDLHTLSLEQLRALASDLFVKVGQNASELIYHQTRIDLLIHELALLRRLTYGRRSEQLTATQLSLLDESLTEDIAVLEAELGKLQSPSTEPKPPAQPKRAPLPANLPRTDIHHEPDDLIAPASVKEPRTGL